MRNLILALPPLAVCLEMRGLGGQLTGPSLLQALPCSLLEVPMSFLIHLLSGVGGEVISVEWPGPCWLNSLLYPIVGTQEDHATT